MKQQYIKIIIILLCCLAGIFIPNKKAYAVDSDVYGYVLTSGTNAPITGVWVKWTTSANGINPGGGAYQYAQTDQNGEFYFHSLDNYNNGQMQQLEKQKISTHNDGILDDTQVSSAAAQTTFGSAGNPNSFTVIKPTGYNGTFYVQGTTNTTLLVTLNNIAVQTNIGNFTFQPTGSTLSGTVFIDSNRNGIQDINELGYQNAIINANNVAVSTDANGNYNISNLIGSATINLTLPPNYGNTTPLSQTLTFNSNHTANFGIAPSYTISGNIFVDANRNGIKDTGEKNFSGTTVTLSGNVNATTTPDSNGNYSFPGLFSGNYTVKVITPQGYINTTPASQTIPLSANQNIIFGLTQVYTISGYAFDDSNKNGILDSGEHIYPGVKVTLSGQSSQSTTTDNNGNYSFINLLPGTYTVTFTNTLSHTNTTPLSQTFTITNNQTINFGTVGIYTVSGQVFIDKNGKGKLNGGDPLYQGATVNLLDAIGNPLKTTTSDKTGNYSFPNTFEGNYKIAVIIPQGYGATTPDLLNINVQNNQTIDFGINILNITKVAGQCTGSTADIVIVIDHSGSMTDPDAATGNPKMDEAKKAMIQFITIISKNVPSARMAIVQFANSSNFPNDPADTSVVAPLTNNITTLTNAVNGIVTTGGTCHECGVVLANQLLKANGRKNAQKMVIFATDGLADMTIASNGVFADTPTAENAAMAQIIDGVTKQNIVYNTIGLGKTGTGDIDVPFMQEIAAANGGVFYDDPDQGNLETIFQNIADNSAGSGIISGLVFEDKNNNGINDTGDGIISNFTLMLSSNRLAQPITTTTDVNGNYTFNGLCNATFTVSEPSQPPWVPTTASSQSIDVISGTTYPNVNFGERLGYTIKGDIFDDANKNGLQEAGEKNYTGGAIITSNAGTIANNPDGTYSITGLLPGTYTISYFSPIPLGYQLVNPLVGPPPFFQVTVGLSCNTNNAKGATCTSGNINNLNFSITNFLPWLQATCSDVRNDNGIKNTEPLGKFLITTNATCTNPGLIFTGDTNPDFGQGGASPTGRVVGGINYPEVDTATPLLTSYTELLKKALHAGITPINLTSVCNLTGCSLPANLPHGIYVATGDMTLNADTFKNNTNYVFLINGNLTINGALSIPVGSTVLFATKGNITVNQGVGKAAIDPSSSLDGWYVAGRSFIINSQGNCNDLRLNIGGTVVVNALGGNGTFQNNRDLCGNDITDPTVSFNQRLDMLLNAPQFVQQQLTVSKELAP